MIGLVTDSNSQLPLELAERHGVEVVPLTVTVDGQDFLEGVDLDADAFYGRFSPGHTPDVATAQPSPGRFAEAYARLVERGATEILSVHIGSDLSGTLNSARLAAQDAGVAVRLVDTGTASFGIACCTWEAGEAIAAGATLEEAASVAEALAARVQNIFLVRALDLARAGGRVVVGAGATTDAIPVVSLVAGEIKVVGTAATIDEAAVVMADHVLAGGQHLRVAVGIADAAAAPLWSALEDRLAGAPQVHELVRYRVGPSVGVHTGPGTAGAFFYSTAY